MKVHVLCKNFKKTIHRQINSIWPELCVDWVIVKLVLILVNQNAQLGKLVFTKSINR